MFKIDPVCKKKLRRKQEYGIVKYGGTVYHLCCQACQMEPRRWEPAAPLDTCGALFHRAEPRTENPRLGTFTPA